MTTYVRSSRGTEISGVFRRFQQSIWSSLFYRQSRDIAAALTRPFRRVDVCTMFKRDLTGYTGVPDALEVEIKQCLSVDEVEQAACLGRPDPYRRELFRWRFQNGCACFVARVGSTLVGYDWIRLRAGIDDGDWIDLAAHEVYTLDAYVAEDWRGHRIHRSMGARMLLFARTQGYTTAYSRAGVFNYTSQKATRRNGWTVSGYALRVRGAGRGGWPIITLYGSSHPLTRLQRRAVGGAVS
jgi:GNAT superfamily N-acetyltransferase